MKIKAVGDWQLELIPEDDAEEKVLQETFKLGHVHLVCKALSKAVPRQKLLLVPSLARWRRSKRGELG